MKVLMTVQEILIWHDGPQLFEAYDSIGGIHLCLAIEGAEDRPSFLVVAISSARLRALKSGQIDLYSVFAKPELKGWLRIKNFEENQVVAEPMPESFSPSADLLPTFGVFLTTQPSKALLLSPESFAVVKVGAVAKEAGINAALLRQYVSGVKQPSVEQAIQVQDALHRVAQRLLNVRFI
jgi:hypothetical protein